MHLSDDTHLEKQNEATGAEVDINRADDVRQGLIAKYGQSTLDAYTFGIELEYRSENRSSQLDWAQIDYDLLKNPRYKSAYHDWVLDKRNELNKRWNGDINDWDDSFGPIDDERYEQFEPLETDGDWQKWHKNYLSIVNAYRKWYRSELYDYMSQYNETINIWDYLDDMERYNISEGIGEDIQDSINYISSEMKEKVVKSGASNATTWAVGEDGDNIVEIRSKHLRVTEMHLVEQICEHISNKDTGGNTSAHVHIGLPDGFDGFDLLAITTLVDEKAIKSTVGPTRALQEFARLRDSLHESVIFHIIKYMSLQGLKSFIWKTSDLEETLKYVNRNHGTNIASQYDTVEFRYLSSQIASHPDIFIKWIRYFILVVQVATSRNKIKLVSSAKDLPTLTAVRLPGQVKFVLDETAPTLNRPVSDLKDKPAPDPRGGYPIFNPL